MPHISENEVEKLRQAIQAARISPATANTINMLDHAQDIVNGIQPAPQSDEVKEAWQKFEEWTQAYPLSSFPEPDLKRCRKLLEDGGESLDRVSASNMRHVLEGLKRILEPVRAQSAPVDLERVREASKRSSYAWSCDGEYTSQDWMNEGAIKLALSLLPPKESK